VLVNRGFPQGRVISPLLWNMVVDGLLCRLHNAHYQAQGYADYVVLLQKGKFMSSYCGKDLGIITEGGGLAIHFRGEAHSFVCFTGMVEENRAEKYS
jgi:hypothetical protein